MGCVLHVSVGHIFYAISWGGELRVESLQITVYGGGELAGNHPKQADL